MEFEYFFNGIEMSDGEYPSAKVLVRAKIEMVPEELMCPRIDITLPISARQSASALSEIAQAALQSARSLLNERAIADWVEAQSH